MTISCWRPRLLFGVTVLEFPLLLTSCKRLVHTRWQVTAKHCGNRSPLVHKWRDCLQQNVRATCCSDKSLHVYQRIFVQICLCNRILSQQQVAKNQIRLNLCNLLQRQRFSHKFSNTHGFTYYCNLSLYVYRRLEIFFQRRKPSELLLKESSCGLILTKHHLLQMTINPLSPNSDQYQNSPCDINAFYNRLVVRIKAMITQDTMSLYFNNFLLLLL